MTAARATASKYSATVPGRISTWTIVPFSCSTRSTTRAIAIASSSPTTRIHPGAIMEGSRASDSHVQTWPVPSSLWKSTSRSTTTALLLTLLTSSSIGRAHISDCPALVQGYRANRSAALPPVDELRQAAGTGRSSEALGTGLLRADCHDAPLEHVSRDSEHRVVVSARLRERLENVPVFDDLAGLKPEEVGGHCAGVLGRGLDQAVGTTMSPSPTTRLI
jgi:hypothetical protein